MKKDHLAQIKLKNFYSIKKSVLFPIFPYFLKLSIFSLIFLSADYCLSKDLNWEEKISVAEICYENMDFPCSIKNYQSALIDPNVTPEGKVYIYERMLLIHHGLGQIESEKEMVLRIYKLNPNYEPNTFFFPPKVLSLFHNHQKKQKREKTPPKKALKKQKSANEKMPSFLSFNPEILHLNGKNRESFHHGYGFFLGYYFSPKSEDFYLGPKLKLAWHRQVGEASTLIHIGPSFAVSNKIWKRNDFILEGEICGGLDFWQLDSKLKKIGGSFNLAILPSYKLENLRIGISLKNSFYFFPKNSPENSITSYNSFDIGFFLKLEL